MSISYAGVLNSFGLGPFHQIFMGLKKNNKKQGKRIKIEVNRITLKFLMRLELRTRVVLNTESSFVQVPFVFRVEEGVGGIRHVMKLFSFPFFCAYLLR